MKLILTSVFAFMFFGAMKAQVDKDTTRMKMGGKEFIIISPKDIEFEIIEGDTINAEPDEDELKKVEAHWAGLEFGPTLLLNSSMKSSFPNDPHWENDPSKSFSWNLNILEHKFPIVKNYFGITTGLGFNWTQIGLRQYNLNYNSDSLWSSLDTVNIYEKNKLKAIYLTAPLMLEFCSNAKGDGFYLDAGVIAGVRIGSNMKSVIESDKVETKEKSHGTYALNSFRLDAALKFGYKYFGVFANYSLLPLFDDSKTATVYPLTFGMTVNF